MLERPRETEPLASLSFLQGIFPTQELNQGVSCTAGEFFTSLSYQASK